MKKEIAIGIILLVLLSSAVFLPASAEEEEKGVLTVSGSASVSVYPDKAVIRLGVLTENESADAALSENSEKVAGILEKLKSEGVEVETDYFSIYPLFSYDEGQKLRGYRVVHMLRAEVDVERAGEIVDLAVLSGANQVSGITFTSSKVDGAKKEALRKAVQNAQEKARIIAQAAGVQIVGIKEITHSSESTIPPYLRYDMTSIGTPITPSELQISASVTVSYWIA